jgi:hypothetical protein
MAIFPVGTGLVTTGNVRTTYDPVVQATPGGSLGDPRSYQLNSGGIGLRIPLGYIIGDTGGVDSVSGTLTQLPLNVVAIYKYVLYKSTTNPALVSAPGLVYYTDETQTVVSEASGDGIGGLASFAGLMMLNTTDLTTVTAALLNNSGAGSGVWICIGGFVKAATSIASTVAGSTLLPSGTAFTPAFLAAGTAPTYVKNMTALTAIAGGVSDVLVNITPIC